LSIILFKVTPRYGAIKQRPSDENLIKIADILEVPLTELFDIEHIKSKEEVISSITNLLPQFTEAELQFFYK